MPESGNDVVNAAKPLRIAAAVIVSAGAVVLVVTRGAATPMIVASDASAWLANAANGTVSHVNGLSAEPDGQVTLPAATGHLLSVQQGGPAAIVVDETAGALGQIDPVQQTFGWTSHLSRNEIVIAQSGAVYALAPGASVVARLDPRTLRPVADTQVRQNAAPHTASDAAVGGDGTLWLTDSAAGAVDPVTAKGTGRPVAVAPAGEPLALTALPGGVAVLDTRRGVLTEVSAGAARGRLPLSAAPANGRLLLGTAAGDGAVPVLSTSAEGCRLYVADFATHAVTTADLSATGDCAGLGAPVALTRRIYTPDNTAGRVDVFDLQTRLPRKPVTVTDHPAGLDLLVLGNRLWANDPDGPDALVIDGDGARRITKYGYGATPTPPAPTEPSTHASASAAATSRPVSTSATRPKSSATARLSTLLPHPSFSAPHQGSSPPHRPSPSPDPTNSTVTASPTPSRGPLTVTAQSGPEYVDLQITPPTGIPKVSAYDVAVDPSGLTTQARTGPNSFRVSTPVCGNFAYTFTVSAHLADGSTLTASPVSAYGCLPPGPVQNVKAVTGNGYIQLSWDAPAAPGTGPSELLYVLAWLDDNNAGGAATGSANTDFGQTSYEITAPMGAHVLYAIAAVNGAGFGPAIYPPEPVAWDLTQCASSASNCTYNHPDPLPIDTSPGGTATGATLPAVPPNTFGAPVTVLCQTSGPLVTLPSAAWAQSTVWDQISYGGQTGYVSDMMISTANSMLLTATPQFSPC